MRQRRPASRPFGSSASTIRARLAALEQTLSDQQQRILQQENEIAAQRAHMAAQTEEISYLRGKLDTADEPGAPTSVPADTRDERAGVTSRRSLLRLGGASAAAGVVVAAGSLYGHVPVAHAAGGSGDGSTIVQGTANVNTSQTGTVLNPVAASSPVTLLTADNSASGSTDPLNAAGVTAIGPKDTNGVIGIGNGPKGTGVWGQSDAGWAVVGQSSTGIDLAAGQSGRLLQVTQGNAGAPTSGSFFAGEQVRDFNGELWLCVASGTPGSWVQASHAQLGFAGGALNFLPVPIRVIDSRTGQNPAAPLPTTKAPLASGQTYTFQITGTAVGSSSVPANATGIYANVTVVFPTNSGNLVFYPADQALPQSSTINYNQGAVVDNFTIVRLSATGALNVFVNGPGNTNVVVDIAGFIM